MTILYEADYSIGDEVYCTLDGKKGAVICVCFYSNTHVQYQISWEHNTTSWTYSFLITKERIFESN